jgi:hypothetical protein
MGSLSGLVALQEPCEPREGLDDGQRGWVGQFELFKP